MGSLIISFIFTFNTLLFFAASNPNWRWPPVTPPSGSFPWGPPFKPPPPPPSGRVDAKTFSQCMNFFHKVPFSDFYDPKISKANFTAVLNSTAQNFRCLNSKIRKPLIIFRPDDESQVPPVVWCAQIFKLNIRIRSGGHDYEGLSYISLMKNQPFMILDLYNLRDIDIDPRTKTAWVQAGATNGELYHKISQVSENLAFPAGLCTSLGIGGHLTGGAYGSMMRKFGLGADNVVDVRMVDYRGVVLSLEYRNGQIWGREHMSDDLFWALRGGGGASFGIILAWKIKLVYVPSKVTMFTVVKSLQTNGVNTLHQWQRIAPKLPNELFIRVLVQAVPNITVITIYQALYLGNKTTLARIMKNQFPDLGVKVENCTEMSWIQSVMNIAGFGPTVKPDYLLQHQPAFLSNYFKAKSDFLRTKMSIEAIKGMMEIFMEQGPPTIMIFNPYGGKMAEIPEDSIPFPHRKGVICKIQYVATWLVDNPETQLRLEDWIRRLYANMTDYVSKNPREAYVNYRDLDIGKKEGTGSNCSYPEIWGRKYFKGNFKKLVDVKSRVDPENFFKHEQSIPTYRTKNQCTDVI